MKRYDVIVIGAGPAGLSAAIEAASHGMNVAVFDENARPGGQLFKQIHKFFGSKEHHAKIRGIDIGESLVVEAKKLGVNIFFNSVVIGIFEPMSISVVKDDCITSYSADNIIVATGASENSLPFDGWTLPGVLGAGAAQTLMNLHGVRPGNRVIMVGTGNVGLVVSYQLLQAGCEVVAIIDASKRLGGYGVHAAKVARTGVPIYTSHTVVKAIGENRVEGVIISKVDDKWQTIPGTEKYFNVDTICIAVGLKPMSQLIRMAGCNHDTAGELVPESDKFCSTSIDGLFVAGDVAGIGEASSAMISGKIAALSAAKRSGYIIQDDFYERYNSLKESLIKLNGGMFANKDAGCTDFTITSEGFPLSKSLLTSGYLTENELHVFVNSGFDERSGIHPVIECTQNIPCNPCQDACKVGCIHVGPEITSLPVLVKGVKCNNCGMCVASCPGQAIFLVDNDYEPGYASITLPYEFLPLPQKGDLGHGLDRRGKPVCDAEVVDVRMFKAYDRTALVTIRVRSGMEQTVRFYKHLSKDK